MEIPKATLITVRSSSSSEDDDASVITNGGYSGCPSIDNQSRESAMFANLSLHSPHVEHFEKRPQKCGIIKGNTQSLESHMLEEIEEMDEEELGSSSQYCKESQDKHIIEVDSPTHLPPGGNHCGHGLHSLSTILVADDEHRTESLEDEVSSALEWFRSTFNKIGKGDRITLRDFKQAAIGCDVIKENIVEYDIIIVTFLNYSRGLQNTYSSYLTQTTVIQSAYRSLLEEWDV